MSQDEKEKVIRVLSKIEIFLLNIRNDFKSIQDLVPGSVDILLAPIIQHTKSIKEGIH